MPDFQWKRQPKIDRIFESIVETTRHPFIVLDSDLRVIKINHFFCETFKILPEETIGNLIYDLGNRQWDIPKLRMLLENIISREDKFENFKVEHTFPDIGFKVIMVNARRLRKSVIITSPMILLGLEDITEQEEMKIALLASEERYRRVFETANDAILLFEKSEGKITHSNLSATSLLGYSNEEYIGKNPQDIGLPFKNADIYEIVQTLNSEGIIHYDDFQMETKYGQFIDSDIYLVDKAALIQCNIRDITERKQSEQAQRKSEDKYRLLFQSVNDSIFVHQPTPDGKPRKFIELNDTACRVYGYTREELMELTPADLLIPEQKGIIADQIKKVLSEGSVLFDAVHKNKEGKPFPVEINAFLCDFYGKRTILSIVRDVTFRKKAEEDLRRAQKMEALGTLAGGIAHDFNNILSSILGYTELALDEVKKNSTIEDSLQEVFAAGKRAKDLVKQILTFARQSDEEIRPLKPGEIAREVLKFLRSSIPTTIKIKQNIESDSLIMGNATHVHQILMNLCTNAAHAMDKEGGILEVILKDVVINSQNNTNRIIIKLGSYIKIKVSDTGVGISPDILGSIFEPYFTTKAPEGGTGIGLSVVYGIVENYGGKITVNSTLGKGTTFSVYLPITKKWGTPLPYQTTKLPTGTERILFVDDEAPIAKIGSQILGGLGYSVTTRTSSVEALNLFRSKPNDFDLIITDMTMPNITGDKLASEIIKVKPNIPIILCTGFSKKISDEIALDIGIKAIVYKPLIKVDLANIVRKVLDEAKNYAQD